MTGMGHAPNVNNPIIVSAFRSALLHQFLVILGILAVVAIAWNVLRAVQFRHVSALGQAAEAPGTAPPVFPEPPARRVLRIGLGLLWFVDGLLQLQQAMPLGLPTNVLQPSAQGAPGWVRAATAFGVTIWERHPVPAAAAAVWIQLGIGVLLLVAPRGRWSRVAAGSSIVWGLIVWVEGEAFGGLFSPGPTWLFGLPGAVLLYVVASVLVALPESAWMRARFGRRLLAASGLYLIAMAALQAWPGRGFWQGRTGHALGPLASMTGQMAGTAQPSDLSSLVASFSRFATAHGWAVNLFVVVVLALSGLGLLSGRRPAVLAGLVAASVLSLAAWVLVQDLGVFGGTGTDPNSMVPTVLLLVASYVAWVAVPATALAVEPARSDAPWWATLTPGALAQSLVAIAAAGVVLVGAVPMAAASMNRTADPILAEATDGAPGYLRTPAPGFSLVDQRGQSVSLAALRGKVVALTFLDPVCTSDCPLIAQEFRIADQLLGQSGRQVEFVAVATNPDYHSVAAVDAFDRQEGLSTVRNWLYLTGSLTSLRAVWDDYGVQVGVAPAGSMIAHPDLAYVIDPSGVERVILNSDVPVGAAGHSSYSELLAQQIRSLLPR